MILNTLHLDNYKQYRRLDLEFREGLVGVVGRNGAGKSTLFEAILYCLFGRDESDKALIRSTYGEAKAAVTLGLSFTLGLERYLVKREFRGKILTAGAELFKNDELVAKGVSAVNDEIVRLLNMERDAFKRSVFSGQKELAELSNATGAERQRMVRKMLGLDNLDDIKKRINDDIRALRQQIQGQEQLLLTTDMVQVLEAEIEAKTAAHERLGATLSNEQEKLDAVATRQRQALEKFEAEEQRQRQHNTRQQSLARLRERHDNLTLQQSALQTRIEDLENMEAGLDTRRAEFADYHAEKAALSQQEDLRRRKAEHDTTARMLGELRQQAAELEARLAGLTRDLTHQAATEKARGEQQLLLKKTEADLEAQRERYRQLDNEISTLRERANARETQIAGLEAIGREGACPTCFQPVRDAYDKVLSELHADLDRLQQQELAAMEREKETVTASGLELKKRLEAMQEELERLRCEDIRLAEVARHRQAEQANQQRLAQQIGEYERRLEALGSIAFDEEKYRLAKDRMAERETHYLEFLNAEAHVRRDLPAAREALKKNAEDSSQATKDIATETQALEKIGFDPKAYEAARAAFSDFEKDFRLQSDAVRALERERQEIQNDVNRRREKIQENARIRALIGDKQTETEVLDRLALSLDTFRNEILEKVSPSISREASALFSRITKGKYESIVVDENFDFNIADGGYYYPIKRFSGGEIDLANFCLRIAITKAIVELSGSGQGIEFLAFDEIFGSQDEERRLEILLALNFLQEQFRQIYIVSHIESLRDYFPNILEVKSTPEGGSTARWV